MDAEMAGNFDEAIRIGFKSVQLFKGSILGIGSYGTVCKAKGDELICAAKYLHPGSFDLSEQSEIASNEVLVKRIRTFEQEIEFLRTIRHPNIVQYLCTHQDTETGLPVIVMELMDRNLTQFLDSGSPEASMYHTQVDICHDIAQALIFLHNNKIIHRDLSSNNVLLIGKGHRAKLSDFGMARLNLKKQTALSRNPGTDEYMPPEALRENPNYTEKMDCFSFGVLVIQILTRKFPEPGSAFKEDAGNNFKRISEEERRQNHISQISENHPLLPLSIKCLNNDDSKRPSAQEICEATLERKESPQYKQSQLTNTDIQIVQDLQPYNELQLEWRTADEKIGVKWNNAVIDNNVIYYICGKTVHAHDMMHSRWTQLAECPHKACPMAIINNQLTTIGGLPLTNKLFTLRTDKDPMSWNECYQPMPTERHSASALCSNNELIVIGGMGERMSVLTAVEVMQLDTSQWSIACNLQKPIYDASIAICLNQIFIVGGNDENWKPSKSVYTCSLRSLLESCSRQSSSPVWNRIADLPVMQSTCVTYSSRLLAVGGRESASNTEVSTVYEYNHTTNSWVIISQMISPRLKCFAAVLPNNKLVVVGGRESRRDNQIEIATPTTNP